MGDLNAKIGQGKYEDIIGQYGLGTRNDRGYLFARFCLDKAMVITNTFFKLPKRRLYTWKSPADTPEKIVRNQIDYITIDKGFRNIVKPVKTFTGAEVPTDHILLLASIRLKYKKKHGLHSGSAGRSENFNMNVVQPHLMLFRVK